MITVLKKILEKYREHKINGIEIRFGEHGDFLYAVIYDGGGKESDFFLFSFQNSFTDLDYETLVSDFSKFRLLLSANNSIDVTNESKTLGTIAAFDKNLNLVIFYQVDNDMTIGDDLRRRAYEIEENPYYFRKKVVFYTRAQVESFNNPNLDLSNGFGDVEQDINDSKKRFILNLLIGLSFIKVSFQEGTQIDKNIFQNALGRLSSSTHECLEERLLTSLDSEEFNDKVGSIMDGSDLVGDIRNDDITELERALLDMFLNGDVIRDKILANKTSDVPN